MPCQGLAHFSLNLFRKALKPVIAIESVKRKRLDWEKAMTAMLGKPAPMVRPTAVLPDPKQTPATDGDFIIPIKRTGSEPDRPKDS